MVEWAEKFWKGNAAAVPWALVFALLAFLVPLGVYAHTGFHSRYWADDYCFSASLQDHGYWPAQLAFYQTTSSRFLVILLIGVTEFFGPGAIRWLPALNLVFLGGSLFVLLLALSRMAGLAKPKLSAAFAAAALLFFLVLLGPNRLQVFFWRAGLFTYSFPLGLFAFNLAFLLRQSRLGAPRTWALALAALLAFLAGGASETFVALQTASLGVLALLALAYLRGEARRRALGLLGAALAGSLLALVVLLVSPANQYRQAYFPPPPNLFALVRMSLSNAFRFVTSSFGSQPLPNLVLLLLGGAAGLLLPSWTGWRGRAIALALIPLAAYVLLVAVVSPSAYAQSSWPEARALIDGRFVTVIWVFFWGLTAAWLGRDWLLTGNSQTRFALLGVLLLIGLSTYPLRAAWIEWPAVEQARHWALDWDARDALLRSQASAGDRRVATVELDSLGGLMEIGPDPRGWVNTCAARYYGFEAIWATPP